MYTCEWTGRVLPLYTTEFTKHVSCFSCSKINGRMPPSTTHHIFSQTDVHATSIRGGYRYLFSSLRDVAVVMMFVTIKDGFRMMTHMSHVLAICNLRVRGVSVTVHVAVCVSMRVCRFRPSRRVGSSKGCPKSVSNSLAIFASPTLLRCFCAFGYSNALATNGGLLVQNARRTRHGLCRRG